MYTFDTNAIIYYLRGDRKAVPILRTILLKGAPIYVSAITELELFGYSGLTWVETELIDNILKTVLIIPVESRIARLAGSIRRNFRVKTSDAAIAATALATGSALVTRNINDFKKIPSLSLKPI